MSRCPRVPRYFFNIRTAGDLIRDLEGIDLPNEAAARIEAVQAAREIIADTIKSGGRIGDHAIQVDDEVHALAFTIQFRDLVLF